MTIEVHSHPSKNRSDMKPVYSQAVFPEIPDEPVREHLYWDLAEVGECVHCGNRGHVINGSCPECTDADREDQWRKYAHDLRALIDQRRTLDEDTLRSLVDVFLKHDAGRYLNQRTSDKAKRAKARLQGYIYAMMGGTLEAALIACDKLIEAERSLLGISVEPLPVYRVQRIDTNNGPTQHAFFQVNTPREAAERFMSLDYSKAWLVVELADTSSPKTFRVMFKDPIVGPIETPVSYYVTEEPHAG